MALSTAFVYGTLQYPQVLQALISRVPRMEPAVIRGYQRHSIRGQVGRGRVNDVQRSVAMLMRGEGLARFTTARGCCVRLHGLTHCTDVWSRTPSAALPQVFPGTVPAAADSSVSGLVLFDLQPAEMEVRAV